MNKKSELLAFRTTEDQRRYLQAVADLDERSVSWAIQKMIDFFRINKSPEQALQDLKQNASQK